MYRQGWSDYVELNGANSYMRIERVKLSELNGANCFIRLNRDKLEVEAKCKRWDCS